MSQHEEEFYEEEGSGGGRRFLVFNAMPSSLVSAAFHAVLLMILALISLPEIKDRAKQMITAAPAEVEELEEMEDITDLEEMELEDVPEMEDLPTLPVAVPTAPEEVMDPVDTPTVDTTAAPAAIEISDFGETTAPKNDLMTEVGAVTGTGLSGRGAAVRGKMVAKFGGNDASEAAVANALKWLAAHQLPDGGWSFGQIGRCTHPGSLGNKARNGATAMALLPFLGAGQTHIEGEYKGTVKRGLYYLMANQNPQTGSFHEGGGTMYSHGLCAIVLCEAYALTHDKALMAPAQGSLNFIVYAQDPVGGGWRYSPRTPGDTSVVGWQLMALKSGHMAYLNVPAVTINKSIRFLDAVQADSGAMYGYTSPGKGPATTAVGLLSRMYLGWKKDHSALQRGVEYLAKRGPSKNNMYFNYYATQVMRHGGGDKWKAWNTELRDHLVDTQSKEGFEKGSWHLGGGDHGSERGGRLYTTAMATMILEVYYRHMPIYQENAATEEFPL